MNLDDTITIPKSFYDTMRSGIFVNPDGRILIIYDILIEEPVEWVEYDKVSKELYIIHQAGTPQALGIDITTKMHVFLLRGTEVTFNCIQNKEITQSQVVPLILQEY